MILFAYNGGLFFPDEILDKIKIDDEVLHQNTVKLSTYDFETDVDVNILGHIFEHSLSEIENVQAEIAGEEIDKQKTKRKKDGIFYTPKYITKYIVENTVGKLCEEKRIELGIVDEEYAKGRKNRKKDIVRALDDKLTAYRDWLMEITILDPACGSGAFLNQALEFLIQEHKKIDELKFQLLGGSIVFPDIEAKILEKNIYGVDLNEESVEIAKLSLWLRTAQKGRKLTTLSNHIKCGNSLIDDPEIAGEKAFKWKDEFPEVFEKGGFDVVFGNPPYVNIANIEDSKIRKYYQLHFETFKNKCDLYSLFIEYSIGLAKNNGKLGFIFPNSWLSTSSFAKFRKKISTDVCPEQLVELSAGVFSDAIVTTVIMILSNTPSTSNHSIDLYSLRDQTFVGKEYKLNIKEICGTENFSYSFEPKIQLKNQKYKLGEIVEFSLGIKTSNDKRFIFNHKIDDNSLPMLRGKDIGRYKKSYNEEYLWYMPELIKEKAGGRPRVLEHFQKSKILIQDIAKTINCTYDDENYVVNDTINVIHEVRKPITKHALIGILNSTLCSRWFNSHFPVGLHIKINQLQEIPIPEITQNEIDELSEKVLLILDYYHQLESLTKPLTQMLQNKFNFEKVSKKLQYWFEFDFKTFLNELNKLKVQFSLSEEADWMQYFNEQKQKALKLKTEIDKTDKKIDQMVYELYGLTEEEVKIVENTL